MAAEAFLTSRQIETAVNWWADVIGGPPRHENLSRRERISALNNSPGSGGLATAVGASMARMIAARHRPTPESIERFKGALTEALGKMNRRSGFWLCVDYGPCQLLADAAEAAGIDESVFPWKTDMWFHDGGVRVRCGYAAEVVELLAG